MLVWNVYWEDWNGKEIGKYNIFAHTSFADGCKKAAKKFKADKDGFSEAVRRELMYYFWSKCEWEIVLGSWPTGRSEEKVDVYDQVMLNWDHFIDYLWNNRSLLSKKETVAK